MVSMMACNETLGLIYVHDSSLSYMNSSNASACNCTSWHDDTVDSKPISILRILTSLCSIIGSASIILSVLLTGKLNAAEVHPLFILSVSDFILAILWMIGGIVWLTPGEHGWASEGSDPHTGMCYVLAVATTMATMVTFSLTAVYAQSAMLRLREYYMNQGKNLPKQDSRKTLRHISTVVLYFISWVIPLIIVLPTIEVRVGIEKTNHGCWCILDFFNLRPDDGLPFHESHFDEFAVTQASILSAFFLFVSILILIYYLMTFYYVRGVLKAQRETLQEQNRSSKMIRTITIRLTCFVLIFIVCGLPSFVASIVVWHENDRLHLSEPVDRVVLYFHAIFSPLQGFLNAIVYGWSRREFRRAVANRERVRFTRSHDHGSRYDTLGRNAISGQGSFLRVNTSATQSS